MNVKNDTHWRTDDLRRVLCACIKHEGLDPKDGWRIRIYHSHRRSNTVSGYAYLGSRTFRIGIPRRIRVTKLQENGELSVWWRHEDELPDWIMRDLIQTTVHEIGHCQGLEHRDMVRTNDINVGWADFDELRVRKKEAAKPPVKPSREDKAREAVDRLLDLVAKEEKRHAAAVKGLRTRLRKAEASVRYYDRKAFAKEDK